jgi:hypothetical protein
MHMSGGKTKVEESATRQNFRTDDVEVYWR